MHIKRDRSCHGEKYKKLITILRELNKKSDSNCQGAKYKNITIC